MILLKAFTKQVGFQVECKQSVGLWWERKSLVVLGSSRLSRLDPSTTRLTGSTLRLQRLSMLLRSDSSPGRDRQCLRLNPSGESYLCRFYRSSRRACSKTGGLPGRSMTA